MPQKQKRKNKSKAELLQEAENKKQIEKLIEEAKRQRKLMREKGLPLLHEMDEEVRFMTVFLHTLAIAAERQADEKKGEILIKDLELDTIFTKDKKESERYMKIYEAFGDESYATFQKIFGNANQMVQEYLYKKSEKMKFNDIDYDEILEKD